jgi:hypothetical protein
MGGGAQNRRRRRWELLKPSREVKKRVRFVLMGGRNFSEHGYRENRYSSFSGLGNPPSVASWEAVRRLG